MYILFDGLTYIGESKNLDYIRLAAYNCDNPKAYYVDGYNGTSVEIPLCIF